MLVPAVFLVDRKMNLYLWLMIIGEEVSEMWGREDHHPAFPCGMRPVYVPVDAGLPCLHPMHP